MIYEELVAGLQAIEGVRFAEYEWKTRPAGDFGTVQLDFEADDSTGGGRKIDRAWEGSVDLYTHGSAMETVLAVEAVLTEICGSSWEQNSEQYERDTGLIHREYVFQLEAR